MEEEDPEFVACKPKDLFDLYKHHLKEACAGDPEKHLEIAAKIKPFLGVIRIKQPQHELCRNLRDGILKFYLTPTPWGENAMRAWATEIREECVKQKHTDLAHYMGEMANCTTQKEMEPHIVSLNHILYLRFLESQIILPAPKSESDCEDETGCASTKKARGGYGEYGV